MNSLSSEVGGTWRFVIGLMYFRNFSSLYASLYSSQFSGTCSSSGTACCFITASSKIIAVLNITSAFSWNGNIHLFSPALTDGQRCLISIAFTPRNL